VLSEETANINVIVFGLTRRGLESMICRTRGEHANNYTTDAVQYPKEKGQKISNDLQNATQTTNN